MGGRESFMSCWLTLMAPSARQQAAFQDPERAAPPQGCGEAGPDNLLLLVVFVG